MSKGYTVKTDPGPNKAIPLSGTELIHGRLYSYTIPWGSGNSGVQNLRLAVKDVNSLGITVIQLTSGLKMPPDLGREYYPLPAGVTVSLTTE